MDPRTLPPPPLAAPPLAVGLLAVIGALRSFVSAFFNFAPFCIEASNAPLPAPPSGGVTARAGAGGGGGGGPGGAIRACCPRSQTVNGRL